MIYEKLGSFISLAKPLFEIIDMNMFLQSARACYWCWRHGRTFEKKNVWYLRSVTTEKKFSGAVVREFHGKFGLLLHVAQFHLLFTFQIPPICNNSYFDAAVQHCANDLAGVLLRHCFCAKAVATMSFRVIEALAARFSTMKQISSIGAPIEKSLFALGCSFVGLSSFTLIAREFPGR